MPDEPEAVGLLALMLLQHSRRARPVDDGGELVTLEEQDRAWTPEIAEGQRALEAASAGAGGRTSFRRRSPPATLRRRRRPHRLV